MHSKLLVSNLSLNLTETNVQELFSKHGKVISVAIPTDQDTGRKRGICFVEMETETEAKAAIRSLHGKNVDGRHLNVDTSEPLTRAY